MSYYKNHKLIVSAALLMNLAVPFFLAHDLYNSLYQWCLLQTYITWCLYNFYNYNYSIIILLETTLQLTAGIQ